MPPAILIILKIWGWIGPFIKEALATSNTLEWAKKHKSVVGLSFITVIQFIMVLLIIDQHQATSTKYQAAINRANGLETELKHSEDKVKVLNGIIASLGVPINGAVSREIPTPPEANKTPVQNDITVSKEEIEQPTVKHARVEKTHKSTAVSNTAPSAPVPIKEDPGVPIAAIRSRLDAISEDGI